ncbi:PQQ-like beta-propeller repeat protein [Streptomyces sp. NBC_00335]|uniref:outer membrane protein assembly factor BamB family protein n=1 Tax=unclassified Streptomyces TaxID=2593676 RepID=UPI00225108F6|nr:MULTISPECIES: PQQ-binding-like beta-propeller repeat protein [unclassified Streptomyces]MCX5409396.1 PQQ-like beta-propeller repeat protein [Streptomyces sp. NBC_00086]
MKSSRPVGRWVLTALLLWAAVTGCGPQQNGPTNTSPKAARAVFEPPAKFDAEAGVPMPEEATAGLFTRKGQEAEPVKSPVALYGEKAYVGTRDRPLVFDTASGASTALAPDVAPVTDPQGGSFAYPVAITEGAEPLVLASFVVERPGTGTQVARTSVELMAVDAAAGRVAWRLSLTVPEWAKNVRSPLSARIVGSSGHVAVVGIGAFAPSAHTTYAIDLVSRRVLWTRDLLRAEVVTKGMVAGITEDGIESEYGAVAGFDLDTGDRRWRGEDGEHPAVGTGDRTSSPSRGGARPTSI